MEQSQNRVYIKNLDYHTTEEDLSNLFSKYELLNVLVPSYTVRFSYRHKRKPLGIAYADFKSKEQADLVIEELDGALVNGRKISLQLATPYAPEVKQFPFFWRSKRRTTTSKPGPLFEDEEAVTNVEEVANSSAEPVVTTEQPKSLLIQKPHGSVTEDSVQQFFKDCKPSRILILKHKKSRINPIHLTGSSVSVLASFDSSETKLDDVVAKLQSQKLNGKYVELQPVNQTQVEELERAAFKRTTVKTITGSTIDARGVVTENGSRRNAAEYPDPEDLRTDATNIHDLSESSNFDEPIVSADTPVAT
ncbi:uncharacterized protein LODBEIA_P03490 [Lodderomyces beijingensis]|uniref:Regulator of rDNA transcription protein 5 n=1 Tax=Lodderomyces beijingensis TaxID=1775926 RepID=A0ABP0ZG23_9ASCO